MFGCIGHLSFSFAICLVYVECVVLKCLMDTMVCAYTTQLDMMSLLKIHLTVHVLYSSQYKQVGIFVVGVFLKLFLESF